MGGTDFYTLYKNPDAQKAFDAARQEAGYERGFGGYSGTIVEKGGFVIVDHTVRTEAQAYKYAERVIGADWNNETDQAIIKAHGQVDDKWGPAGAIPVCLTADEVERTIKLTMDIEPDRDANRIEWEKVLRAEGKLKPGDTFQRVRLIEKNDRTRLEAARTEGKAVIRYFYVNAMTPDSRPISKGDRKVWLSGFTSMAEWRAHAKKIAKEHGGRYEAFAITRRFDDEPLDVVEAVVTRRTVTIEATISSPGTKKQLTTDGWLFFGWASC